LFDPDDQAGMYLRALAEGKIFDTKADPVVLLADKKTPLDVLIMAIGLEKDSIMYYVGLKATMARQSDKDKVEAIIAEEIAHIVTLSKRIDVLK
jgi:rubrerythrin